MKIELRDKLYEKYPKIFKQKGLSIRESCMGFGCECGSGWYWLIDNLCDCMQRYIDANKVLQVEATQVKEKYGGLDFNICGGDELTDGMIWFSNDLSYNICEECGSTEDVTQTKGWIRTVCKKCMEKEGRKIKCYIQ
jgi:hypothetical protein